MSIAQPNPQLPIAASVSSAFALAVMNADEFARFFPRGLTIDGEPVRRVNPTNSADLTVWCRQWRPQVLICSWSTPMITSVTLRSAGGSVKYVCNVTGSVRHIVDRELITSGVMVTNWGRLIAPQVAEHALLLILGALRNVRGWDSILRTGKLDGRPALETRSLFRKKIGLHGFGAIAKELIQLLAPFSVRIETYSDGVPFEHMRSFGVSVAPSLTALARGKDVFVCCEALTEQTRGSINRDVLGALPVGAVFCNVGRGAVVDEIALAELAFSKNLRIASDVFAEEPLATHSPLLANELALLSPHIGGPTQDCFAECGDYALENIQRFKHGQKPDALITPEVFDRST